MSTAHLETETRLAPATLAVKVADIAASPTNPRKTFDETQLAELTSSVQAHGILQPVLLRPDPSDPDRYELVAGERRWRAAMGAGLQEIPALVRDLGDKDVLEIQVIENLQRSDLHPLEEAEGYEQLQRVHGYTVEDLAAKVGKGTSYVYARMKLCALVPDARKAFYSGKLTPSTALLVARIPVPDLQKQAVAEIIKDGGEPMTVRDAQDHLQSKYMLRLKEAPFQTDDPDLVPAAGPCTTCPKRTGNQRELFVDVKSPDVCTDPGCFAAKKAAGLRLEEASAEARGLIVIPEKDYVQLDARCDQDPKGRHWRAVLGKEAKNLQRFYARRTDESKGHELVDRAAAEQLLKSKAPAVAKVIEKQKSDKAEEAEDKRRAEKLAAREELAHYVVAALIARVVERAFDLKVWRFVAGLFVTAADYMDGVDNVFERRIRQAGTASPAIHEREPYLKKLSEAQLRALTLEVGLLSNHGCIHSFVRNDKNCLLARAAEVFGTDLKTLEAEGAKLQEAAKPMEPPAATEGPAAKATTKKAKATKKR